MFDFLKVEDGWEVVVVNNQLWVLISEDNFFCCGSISFIISIGGVVLGVVVDSLK